MILEPDSLKKLSGAFKKEPATGPKVLGQKQRTEGFSRALQEPKTVAEAYSSSRTIFKPEK